MTLISTHTIHDPAYLQADPLKRDHFLCQRLCGLTVRYTSGSYRLTLTD